MFEDISTLGEIRLIATLERDTGDLMDLDPALIKGARSKIEDLREKARADPASEKADRWRDEAESIQWALSDLFTYRLRKIVGMAQTAAIAPVTLDPGCMLPDERIYFCNLTGILHAYVKRYGIENDYEISQKPIDTDDGPVGETIEDYEGVA